MASPAKVVPGASCLPLRVFNCADVYVCASFATLIGVLRPLNCTVICPTPPGTEGLTLIDETLRFLLTSRKVLLMQSARILLFICARLPPPPAAKKLRGKLDYMHANPVKRKLVLHPKDWPWSSWSHYEKGQDGLIAIDSIGEEEREQGATGKRKSQTPHP